MGSGGFPDPRARAARGCFMDSVGDAARLAPPSPSASTTLPRRAPSVFPSLADGATGDRPHRAPQQGNPLLRVPGSDAGGPLDSRVLPAPGGGAAPVCSSLVFGAHPSITVGATSTNPAHILQPPALHPSFARLPSLADGAIKSRAGGPRGRLETPRMRLASAGPSAARTQGAALGGVKCKPEDTAARSVSAAAGGARGASRRPQDLGCLPVPAVGAVRVCSLSILWHPPIHRRSTPRPPPDRPPHDCTPRLPVAPLSLPRPLSSAPTATSLPLTD